MVNSLELDHLKKMDHLKTVQMPAEQHTNYGKMNQIKIPEAPFTNMLQQCNC